MVHRLALAAAILGACALGVPGVAQAFTARGSVEQVYATDRKSVV